MASPASAGMGGPLGWGASGSGRSTAWVGCDPTKALAPARYPDLIGRMAGWRDQPRRQGEMPRQACPAAPACGRRRAHRCGPGTIPRTQEDVGAWPEVSRPPTGVCGRPRTGSCAYVTDRCGSLAVLATRRPPVQGRRRIVHRLRHGPADGFPGRRPLPTSVLDPLVLVVLSMREASRSSMGSYWRSAPSARTHGSAAAICGRAALTAASPSSM
jgi:hypothetical protein